MKHPTPEDLAVQTIGNFLARLAARVPAPGGGATAALHGAQAAALLAMVARYSTGERYAAHVDVVRAVLEEADAQREVCIQLAAADSAAFIAVTDAYRLPQATADEKKRRRRAIEKALVGATAPPVGVVRAATALVCLAETLLPVANRNVITDVAAATVAARAAATTARLNIEINLGGIEDRQARCDLDAAVDVDRVSVRADAVERAVRELIRR